MLPKTSDGALEQIFAVHPARCGYSLYFMLVAFSHANLLILDQNLYSAWHVIDIFQDMDQQRRHHNLWIDWKTKDNKDSCTYEAQDITTQWCQGI